MNLNDFTEKFASCFTEKEAKTINQSTEFRKLEEWNSMMALIIISTIDEAFNLTLTANDLRASTTITDLFERLTKQ